MRVSVELIPRGEDKIHADAMTVREAMPTANTFNVPDLMRMSLRSWEACAITSSVLPASIPHIRAIDIAPGGEAELGQAILASGLSEILVVKGDPPRDMSRRTYQNTSEAVIHRFKHECPGLRVYAAFDPYRHGFRDEMDGVVRKLDAGADGFFTQPIFDLRLLEISAEMLRDQCVFWGDRSRTWSEITGILGNDEPHCLSLIIHSNIGMEPGLCRFCGKADSPGARKRVFYANTC